MIKKYILSLLVACFVFSLINAINFNSENIDNSITMKNEGEVTLSLFSDATITGTATVCLNQSPFPQLIFTGSGGSIPYAFTYNINGGANQTISTTGTNNSVSLSVNTNTSGFFVYNLILVEDGDGDSDVVNETAIITVEDPPTIDFTFDDNLCSGSNVQFVPSVSGNGPFTYLWEFGDGNGSTDQSPIHVYSALGCGFSNFTAELTVTDVNGCSTIIDQIVGVEQRPNLSFEDLNAGFTAPFDNCGNNTVDPAYVVDVGNASTSDSCVTSYDLDWGDGTSETNVTFPITHTYTQLGSFNLMITGYGDTGCNTTETILVKNSSNPTGSIINPGDTVNLCLPANEIGFEIGSWGVNAPDTNYFVDFGDGTQELYTQADLIAAVANFDPDNPGDADPFPIPHTYTESNCPNDSYTVTLIISTSCGETILTAGPIIILAKPEPDFEVDPIVCVDTSVAFINTTEGGSGPNCSNIINFIWDLGDGNTSTLENPTHIYTVPGTYTVTLTSESFCGTTDPISKIICVEPQIVADFTVNSISGCAPFEITTTNTTNLSGSCGGETYLWEVNYIPDFCGISEAWTFTNATNENSANPSIQFNSAGQYELIMTTTNSCGNSIASQIIEVKEPPTASINPVDDACGAIAINPSAFVDVCAPDTETITYSWSFAGGTPTTSNSLNPGTINYSAIGDYTISFSVTNSCGTTTVTEDFSINETPTITNTDFTQTICSGAETMAINLVSDTANTTYSWTSNNPAGLTGYLSSGTSSEIPSQTLINITNTTETLIYTVIPQVGECEGAPVNFEIVVEPAPLITVQPLSYEVCLNGMIPDLEVSFQGTGTPNYQWYENTVDNTTTGTAIAGAISQTFLPPTNIIGNTYYYVIVTFSTGGCNEIISDTALIEVNQISQIDIQPNDSQSICVGGLASELSISVSGGAGIPTYQWFSNTINSNTGGTTITGAINAMFTPPVFSMSGTFYYYVEVNYDASGCSSLISTVSEILVVDDPTVVNQPVTFQSLCQNSIPNNLDVSISNGLGNISYQWYVNTTNTNSGGTPIPGEISSVYTPSTIAVGTLFYYCIIKQDVSGCEVTSLVGQVEVTAAAQFTNQPISDELCLGETTADLVVSYTNGTGVPSYQWYENTVNDTASGIPISGATTSTYSPNVSVVGTTYYYCNITLSSGGCSEIISEVSEIIINQTPNISDADFLICSDNIFEYIPNSSNGDSVPANTTYTWTIPVVNPVGSITGASEQLTNSTTISQLLVNTTTNPATVTYTITPISGNCVGVSFEVVVTVNPSISVTSQLTNNDCFESNNASIEISIVGGVPFSTGIPYNISWAGPNGFTSNDEDIFNLEAGTYTLDIIDDGGCPYSEIFIITEPDILEFSFVGFNSETISCFGANDGEISIDIAGGTMPYNYSWTLDGLPFSSDEDLTNLGSGNYTASVNDSNNCGPITLDFSIIEPDLLQVTLDAKTDVICFGENTGAISINANGGRLDYVFFWTGPNGFTSTNQNINSVFAGIYNVTLTDSSGCTDSLEVEVIQNDEITIDLTTTEIECYNDNNASITINSISGGVPPYDIAWNNFGTGNSQTNLSAGTYTITITDAENCSKDFSIVIDEAPIFLIDPLVTQMSCSNENDASIVLNFQGGIDPITVVWDDDSTAGVERNNLAPGDYSVTITDGTPCVIEESFTIFDISPLVLSANVTNALDCDDTNSGAINILIQGGTPPFSFVWSNGAITEDLENIPPNTYTVIVADANGCEIEGSWEVNRFEPLVVEVDTQSEVDCDAQTVNQIFVANASGGVPPFEFSWSSGTVSGLNNELMTTEENGLVILEVTDSIGCTTNYSFNVDIPVLGDPDFDISSFGFINFGVFAIQDPIQFTNTATGDYISILWDFGDGAFSSEENPVHTYLQVGNYVVTQTVTYPLGCVYIKVVTLVVEKGYKLIMPDAFTPNDDGLNDFFGPEYIGLKKLELNIYDTWGSLIYSESGDDIMGWDGKINDEEVENGNYYYTFSASTFYDDVIEKQGAFVFIK